MITLYWASVFATVAAMFATGLSAVPALPGGGARHPAQTEPASRVYVEPSDGSVFAGDALRFHARIIGGTVGAETVRWSAFGAGTIDGAGVFSAPPLPGAFASVVATIGADAGGARVTVVGPPPQGAEQAVVACYSDGSLEVRGAYDAPAFGRLAVGDEAGGVAITGDATSALASSGDRVASVEFSSMIPRTSAPLTGAQFGEVAVLAGGRFAAVTNANAGSDGAGIAIFRLRRGDAPRLASTASVGETPEGIVVDADGRTMYVAAVNGNVVTRLVLRDDGQTRKTGSVRTGTRPFGVAVDTRHHLLLVADNDTPTLSGAQSQPGLEAFSLPTMRRVGSPVSTGSPNALPLGVAVDSGVSRLFVTNEGDDDVAVYSLPSLRREATLRVGRTPWLPSVDVRRHLLYVPNARDDTLDIFDTRTLARVKGGIASCSYPVGVAVRSAKINRPNR